MALICTEVSLLSPSAMRANIGLKLIASSKSADDGSAPLSEDLAEGSELDMPAQQDDHLSTEFSRVNTEAATVPRCGSSRFQQHDIDGKFAESAIVGVDALKNQESGRSNRPQCPKNCDRVKSEPSWQHTTQNSVDDEAQRHPTLKDSTFLLGAIGRSKRAKTRRRYKHQSLDSSQGEIRLCRLLPPRPSDAGKIRLTLRVFKTTLFNRHDRKDEQFRTQKEKQYRETGETERHADGVSEKPRSSQWPHVPTASGFEDVDEDHNCNSDNRHKKCKHVLPSPRAYTTLSYTWGPDHLQHEIVIFNRTYLISENLWCFFHHMSRQGNFHTWYFIDQVCINQSDHIERSQQVQRMGEIYANAAAVCIWLGTEANNSNVAIRVCNVYHTRLQACHEDGHEWEHAVRELKADWRPGEKRAVVKLLERAYWSRLWIIQELFHAQRVEMRCGAARFPLEGYATRASLQAIHALIEQATGTKQHHPIYWPPTYAGEPQYLNLHGALRLYSSSGCVDARDQVLGLLGCVKLEQRVDIDYEQSVEDVFWSAVKVMSASSFIGSSTAWTMRRNEEIGI